MEPVQNELKDPIVLQKAQRARRIIYIVMAVLIVLPFVAAWLAGGIRF